MLERRTSRDVLTAVLHSILFHRLFGTVKPDVREVLDITMVRDFVLFALVESHVRIAGSR